MYLSKIVIENIRSIRNFKLAFAPDEYKGWHVILGDNGAGKSSIIRSISLALIGPTEAIALRQNWDEWLRWNENEGTIDIEIERQSDFDKHIIVKKPYSNNIIPGRLSFLEGTNGKKGDVKLDSNIKSEGYNPKYYYWDGGDGWFSVAYGPFRRFTGGNKEVEKIFYSNPKAGAHLSAFGEDIALTESLSWLQNLHFKRLDNPENDNGLINDIKNFINNGNLLPHGATIETINTEGVFFKDGNGALVNVIHLSDGYRSILSMTFELIKRLVEVYEQAKVFKNIRNKIMNIDLPGIVLIDEIDAHLHPVWQIKIGEWFTNYFPNIQFIVTTHSPLICRSALNGSIWQLAAPGSDEESKRIEGKAFERLVYGNVLEAYGTEVFGQSLSRSKLANDKLDRMAALNIKSFSGDLNKEEKNELAELKGIFPTGL